LIPALATKPPIAQVEGLKLIRFRGSPPSRRLAMLWRESSPLSDLLQQLAQTLSVGAKAILAAKTK
ncbi:MAG: DNA-binding transcriptional regulator OxyR, partial [Gammaproteobacteria bacterium]